MRVGDEGFTLAQVNRSIETIQKVIEPLFGTAEAPIGYASEIVGRQGNVALGDIGCGTGRALSSWRRAVIDQTGCDPGMVSGVGITLEDYSMFRDPLTAEEWQDPNLRYIVRSITRGVDRIPTDSLDVAIGYLSVVHWNDPARGLEEVARIIRPGGRFIFNTFFPDTSRSRAVNTRLTTILEKMSEWHLAGHGVLAQNTSITAQSGNPSLQIYHKIDFKAADDNSQAP